MISENTVALRSTFGNFTQESFVLAIQSPDLTGTCPVDFHVTAANPIYADWLYGAERLYGAEALAAGAAMLVPVRAPQEETWLHGCLPNTFVELVRRYAHQCIGRQQMVSFEATLEAEFSLTLMTSLVPIVEAGQVVRVVGLCQNTAEIQRLQQEVQLLRTATMEIAQAPDFPSALSLMMRQICLTTGWVFAEAWIPNAQGTRLEFSNLWYSQADYDHLGYVGFDGDPSFNLKLGAMPSRESAPYRYLPFRDVSKKLVFAPGEGVPGKVWQTQQPQWIADVAGAPDFTRSGAAAIAGFKTGLAIPLVAQGNVVAVVVFFMAQACQEAPQLMESVTAIATQLAALQAAKQTETELRTAEQKYRALFERAFDGIFQATIDGRFITVNPTLVRILGYDTDTELLAAIADIRHQVYVDPQRRDEFVSLLQERETLCNFESQVYRKDGSMIWITENAHLLRDDTGKVIGFEGSVADITARRHADATLRHQAFHDQLTGLPNRMLFDDRLQIAIANAHRNGHPLAVMFLDLDRFKNINDTLGHAIGDLLLQGVAQRVATCLRESDTISRWGGDEFTVILPQLSDPEDASKAAQRILESLRPAFYLEGHELYIGGSMGISLYPRDGDDALTLLKHADAALYHVKEQGRNGYQVYTSEISSKATERLLLENNLHHALDRDEFVICYQPQVNISTWEVTAMEALVRWQHPVLGTIAPNVFIPLAEEIGLIGAIDEWVIRTACAQYKEWLHLGCAPKRIVVNLSSRRFQQPQLATTIARILAEVGLSPFCLELEITEITAMQDVDFTTAMLCDLHKMGIHISLDDFGTGYSSLSSLKRFPLHTIKIDQSFIQELPHNSDDVAIASSVIALGRGLNLNVIAEGVETVEQLECLQSLNCDEMQGYLFSEPVAADTATQFLKTHDKACAVPLAR